MGESVIECLINARFNRVRDELTFNADDKTHTSESPMSVLRKKKRKGIWENWQFINILSSSSENPYEKLLLPPLDDNPWTSILFPEMKMNNLKNNHQNSTSHITINIIQFKSSPPFWKKTTIKQNGNVK